MDFASQIPDMITNAGRELVRRLTATSNTPLLPFVPKWSESRHSSCGGRVSWF